MVALSPLAHTLHLIHHHVNGGSTKILPNKTAQKYLTLISNTLRLARIALKYFRVLLSKLDKALYSFHLSRVQNMFSKLRELKIKASAKS